MKQLFLSLFFLLPYFGFSKSIKDDTKGLIQQTIELKLGTTPVNLLIYQRGKSNGIVYFNMHDNENTCVLATKTMIDSVGEGKLIELSHDGKRLISFYIDKVRYKIDPNRIFTPNGIKESLIWYGPYSEEAQKEVERFAEEIIKEVIKDTEFIVALHNNTDLKQFSIHSFDTLEGKFKKDVQDTYYNSEMHIGNFFYTINEKHFHYFKNKKMSTVLQNQEPPTDDGSLSMYCAKKRIAYINVEAFENELKAQFQMLEIVHHFLSQKDKNDLLLFDKLDLFIYPLEHPIDFFK
jgi:hypothetical protein